MASYKLNYYRGYRVRNLEQTRKAVLDWKKKNPEKSNAHQRVYRAVQTGRLQKPDHCPACGNAGPVHAHHDDYSKPLDVKWLCSKCHGVQHRA